jgi:hypothetical protein
MDRVLNFRPWRLVRAVRLEWRLSLKLGLGFWGLIPLGALRVRELRRELRNGFRVLERG